MRRRRYAFSRSTRATRGVITRSTRGSIRGGGLVVHGGAVTLIACRGQILVSGTIDAGGGGGGGRSGVSLGEMYGGGGGGAGGNVVLQGMEITVTEQVFANGGGGGAGYQGPAQTLQRVVTG